MRAPETPYIGMALWLGRRYLAPFAQLYPEDFLQVCALAGWEERHNKDEHDAFNAIQRRLRAAAKGYGFVLAPNGGWRHDLFIDLSRNLPSCGVCGREGKVKNERYGMLCGAHYMKVYHNRALIPVSKEAVRRYRERIRAVPDDEAETAIEQLLFAATKYVPRKNGSIAAVTPYCRLIIRGNVVVTVLESEEKQQACRRQRKRRRVNEAIHI